MPRRAIRATRSCRSGSVLVEVIVLAVVGRHRATLSAGSGEVAGVQQDAPREGEQQEFGADQPRVLAELGELLDTGPSSSGVLFKLAESGRQLDANVVRLAAGQHVDQHTEPDLDVLLIVLRGRGVLRAADSASCSLTEGTVLWLPRGSTRSITACEVPLSYLTAHVRRPGMQIGRDRAHSRHAS